jgi:hypothetical protein
MSKYAGEK